MPEVSASPKVRAARAAYDDGQEGPEALMAFSARIGINPISWTNDDLPSLGGETPLETALTEGKAIGYEGFELGNKFPREPRSVARRARAVRPRVRVRLVFGAPRARQRRRRDCQRSNAHLALLAAQRRAR